MLSETFYRKGIWGLHPIIALIMLILADNHGLQSGALIKLLSTLITPHQKEL